MSNNRVILLLGSNLKNKKKNLELAKQLINQEIAKVIKESEILESQAEDYESPNTFVNQTIKIHTHLSPIQLLNKIKQIENSMGRVYQSNGERYQDRIIDIDILTFNELIFKSTHLNIPHHQIHTRKFLNNITNFLLKG